QNFQILGLFVVLSPFIISDAAPSFMQYSPIKRETDRTESSLTESLIGEQIPDETESSQISPQLIAMLNGGLSGANVAQSSQISPQLSAMLNGGLSGANVAQSSQISPQLSAMLNGGLSGANVAQSSQISHNSVLC
ncbi:unnamed protein product, partial [Meganyctiphanes norvegica]